jgi:nicotinic acid mononucleotide adenylyltransferase
LALRPFLEVESCSWGETCYIPDVPGIPLLERLGMGYFLLLTVLFTFPSYALVLEDLIQDGKLEFLLKNKKVGYMTGSLDPLHRGHEAFAGSVIDQGFCDYVIVTPSWGGDSYKKRIDVKVRLDMLFDVYADHPQVIVTRLNPKELQDTFLVFDEKHKASFKPAFAKISFRGLIGTDTAFWLSANKEFAAGYMRGTRITEKDEESTLGGCIALPASAFIVAIRDQDDLSPLGGFIHERPIQATINCKNERTISSTLVKKRIKTGESFNSMVSDPVRHIIENQGLYRN